MAYPLVVVAGIAIAVGAGYIIYSEFLANRLQCEEAYHRYCATIRAEKEARTRRLDDKNRDQKQDQKQEQEQEDEQDQDQDPKDDKLLRRRRPQHQHEPARLPLIDLSQQAYPPMAPGQWRPDGRLGGAEAVIFAAPAALLGQRPSSTQPSSRKLGPSPSAPAGSSPQACPPPPRGLCPADDALPRYQPPENQLVHTQPQNPLDHNRVHPAPSSAPDRAPDPTPVSSHPRTPSPAQPPPPSPGSLDDGWSDLGSETFEAL